ncbi:MAG: hypothetical protein ACR2M1_17730 [Gemmatimonadaceae bacterium]
MKYTSRNFTVPLTIATLALGACAGEKKSDTLAQDTTLNRDIQLANGDSAVQPQLRDVPATVTPAPVPAAPAPVAAPTTRSPVTAAPRRTTTTTTRTVPRPTVNTRTDNSTNSSNSDNNASRTTTTSSGNTVTRAPNATASRMGTIAAGSTIDLTSSSRVCTNTDHVGDRVSATVTSAVVGSNGAVIPAGATASLEITELKRSENANDKIVIGFRVRSVSFGGKTYPVDATVNYAQVDRVRNESRGKDAQKVATGAAVGAIVGQILGKSTKSTIIGGAVGAAAGAGAAVTTANYEGCVPDGGRITIALQNSVQVQS